MKTLKKWVCLVLGVCLAATLLAACGEDEDSANSNSSSPASSGVAPATLPPSPTPEQTAKAVKVKADDGLNVRSKGSTDGDILGLAKNGSKLALLVEDEKDGWYQVSYGGKAAYVSADYVDVVDVTLDEYNSLKESAGSRAPSSSEDKDGSSSVPDADGSSAPGSGASAGQDTQDKE